jgi:hypothetical protein
MGQGVGRGLDDRAVRRERLLVLVLTRRCDRRCAHCPQSFSDLDMEPGTLDAAVLGLRPLLAEPARVKLFGGEPLLRADLAERAVDLLAATAPGTPVELPTNGRRLPGAAGFLARRPEVEVFVSRPLTLGGRLPGAVHSFLIPPGEPPARTARRFMDARRRGYRRFNFLPAYFTAWTADQLKGLDEAFAQLSAILGRLSAAGRPVETVNLTRQGSTPLYNDGLTVDADGTVYASNLVLAGAVAPRRERLRLGRVEEPELLREFSPSSPDEVLRDSFPAEVLQATRSADAALTRFCLSLEKSPVSPARTGCGARSDGGTSFAR